MSKKEVRLRYKAALEKIFLSSESQAHVAIAQEALYPKPIKKFPEQPPSPPKQECEFRVGDRVTPIRGPFQGNSCVVFKITPHYPSGIPEAHCTFASAPHSPGFIISVRDLMLA